MKRKVKIKHILKCSEPPNRIEELAQRTFVIFKDYINLTTNR